MDPRITMLVAVMVLAPGMPGVAGASTPDDTSAAAPAADREPDQAQAIFETLVTRYRGLTAYEDSVAVVETVTRDGGKPHRVETRLACRIENDQLRIDSPGAQVRGSVALPASGARSNAMETLALRYNLWIAPHLALRFQEHPLAEFRLGVPQGFVVAGAEPATRRDRQFIKLTLQARVKDADAAGAEVARYVLWVDPDAMLVERITGRQTLPDGAEYRLTMDITPVRAE